MPGRRLAQRIREAIPVSMQLEAPRLTVTSCWAVQAVWTGDR